MSFLTTSSPIKILYNQIWNICEICQIFEFFASGKFWQLLGGEWCILKGWSWRSILFKITFLTAFIPIIKLYNQILIFWHSWSLVQHIFVVFGVLSYVVATKGQNHLYHRIPHIFPQILSGKSCMGVYWEQSRSMKICKFCVFHYFFKH